jgi:flavin-dependent thymidylate synthase
MKVTLLNYTKDAKDLLLITKNTRLSASIEESLVEMKSWDEEKKDAELDYMLKTIQSSWEFVDYTFLIEGVSRAFTHQLVRTRTASFAQQSQRTVDMEDFEYVTPKNLKGCSYYEQAMRSINEDYFYLKELGFPPQDARGILPTNICTSIIGKFNLRTMSDMAKKRLCPRTQGEYQDVFKEMRNKVIEVHQWAEKFIRVYCAAVGVCQFPNFLECPIKGGLFNPETGLRWDGVTEYETGIGMFPEYPNTLEQIQKDWEQMDFEATPKWKGQS